MDLIQLKSPPDRVVLMAAAIAYAIEHDPGYAGNRELAEILTWLKYRIERWNNTHPPAAAG